MIWKALLISSIALKCEGRDQKYRRNSIDEKRGERNFIDVVGEEIEFWNRFALLSFSMSMAITEPPSFTPSISPTFPCNISPAEREASITETAISISGESLVLDLSTPQGQALDWLVNIDSLFLCPDDISAVTQRYAMAVFHLSTGVVDSSSLLNGATECEWFGITCQDGSITQISFEEPLGGTLPIEISEFTELVVLDLEDTMLSGPIPSTIGQLQNLRSIDLNRNSMTGTLPQSLFELSNLQVLDLDTNSFSGTLSPDIGNLSRLIFIQLEENKFSGPIPDTLGSLDALTQATFDRNDFTGTMPDSICANRGDGISGGFLLALNADCPPQFNCDCCTTGC